VKVAGVASRGCKGVGEGHYCLGPIDCGTAPLGDNTREPNKGKGVFFWGGWGGKKSAWRQDGTKKKYPAWVKPKMYIDNLGSRTQGEK